MIETECFDDLNVFHNPDGSLVTNLDENAPPLDEDPSKTSCCFRFLFSSSHSTPSIENTGSGLKWRSQSRQLSHRATENHNNAATDSSTNESVKPSPSSIITSVEVPDPLEGIGPPLDQTKLAQDESGEGILDLAILRTEALELSTSTIVSSSQRENISKSP